MDWLPWVIGAALLIALFVWRTLARRLSVEQAQQIRVALEDGAKLVDVRTPQEFAAGHVIGAINIPMSQLGSRTRELGKRGKPLVVYCHTGSRSRHAVRFLQQQGYKRVLDLKAITNHGAVGLATR